MKLTIQIGMDNAAFEDAPLYEVERILASICLKLNSMIQCVNGGNEYDEEKLRDTNGNTVGFVRLEE